MVPVESSLICHLDFALMLRYLSLVFHIFCLLKVDSSYFSPFLEFQTLKIPQIHVLKIYSSAKGPPFYMRLYY